MTFENKTCLSVLKVWSLMNVIFSKTSTHLAIPQVRRPSMSESEKAEAFRGRKKSLKLSYRKINFTALSFDTDHPQAWDLSFFRINLISIYKALIIKH